MKETNSTGGDEPIIRHLSKQEHAGDGQQQPKASRWLDFSLDRLLERYENRLKKVNYEAESDEEDECDDDILTNLFNFDEDRKLFKFRHNIDDDDDDIDRG